MARTKKTPEEKKAKAKERNKAVAADLAANGPSSPFFAAWIKSALRRASRKWPAVYMLLSNTPTKMLRAETKRPGVFKIMRHKQCAACRSWFPQRDIAVDHIVDVGGPGNSPEELGRMTYRLLAPISGMQLLCAYKLSDTRYTVRSCHNIKTHGEGPQGPKPKAAKPKKAKKSKNKSVKKRKKK